jgi:exodeoxyribonuclease VII large subunit
MARRPFDPKRVLGGEDAKRPARREQKLFEHVGETAQLTVSQVADLIKTTLESRIPSPLRVIGEVSNLNAPGHWYFSLKDDAAVLSCVAWASAAAKFGFVPKDGDEVVATGYLSHYGPQGKTQLYVSMVQPLGAGALELRFRAMCEELRKLGYFDEARKRPLPVFPRRIAVITSASGAAVHDVVVTAAQRCKAVALLIVDVRVQGAGAAEDVARAIRWVDSQHARLRVDAILVTRGGGSIEDLWAFNERIVADAAHLCSIPLVAAIGHESDTTVIELVADVRAATPTQAAMRLVPSRDELLAEVGHVAQRLLTLVRRRMQHDRHRVELIGRHRLLRGPAMIVREASAITLRTTQTLQRSFLARLQRERAAIERLAARLGHLRPQDLAARRRQTLAVLTDRLTRALRHRVMMRPDMVQARRELAAAAARRLRLSQAGLYGASQRLEAIGPQRVLARGYSITMRKDGRLMRSIRDVRRGDGMITRVSDGEIESIVGQSRPQPTGRGSGKTSSTQLDLF